MNIDYKHKYKKYKDKYLRLRRQFGGGVDEIIRENIAISNYFKNLDNCSPYFGVDSFDNLSGRDTSSSGAYITDGSATINGQIYNIVIKFFINQCRYKYRKKPTIKRLNNNGYNFPSRNEIGTMNVLTDFVLQHGCSPNITWFYKGGICKSPHHTAIDCRKTGELKAPYLFQDDDHQQSIDFTRKIVQNFSVNIQDETPIYSAITNDNYIPYMIVEKCDQSLSGFVENSNKLNTTSFELDKIFKSIIAQIIITFKILRQMFVQDEYINIPFCNVHDGCCVEIDDKKLEIEHLFRDNDIFKMILVDNNKIEHNDTMKYFKKTTFSHNDCHIGNILLQTVETNKILTYELNCTDKKTQLFNIPCSGKIAKLWDFDTCDIVFWKQLKSKYYAYYDDISDIPLNTRIDIHQNEYINDIYTFFDTFLNGNGQSISGIFKNKSLQQSETTKFLKKCISLGKTVDFIKLLLDTDQKYIELLVPRHEHIIELSHFFDEYREKKTYIDVQSYVFDDKKHRILVQ